MCAVVGALAWMFASSSYAQPVITGPDAFGVTWAEVGDPGNVPARAEDYALLQDSTGRSEIASVNYTFRISQTELTVGQQFEFAKAYTRVFPSALGNYGLGGYSLGVENGQWDLIPQLAPYASNMSFIYAMRLCNWLQNGRAETPEAFETGAYNVAQFGVNALREPNAQYWIPSLDEWVKAMHYDPNRYGNGQGGYWLYPTMSDDLPIGGPPDMPGAETGAGVWDREPGTEYPVGSYPDTMSPWGVLDGAGANPEWLGDPGVGALRFWKGAGDGSRESLWLDGRLDWLSVTSVNAAIGLRIATVPAPCTGGGLAILFLYGGRKRK